MIAPAAEETLRAAVLATACEMNRRKLNRGRSGNVSARLGDTGFEGFVITPSGMDYAGLAPHEMVALDADGAVRDAHALVPSSEWRFHREIYRERPDARAIVHAHSPFATTLACLHRAIPAFHYMIAVAGGADIRCAPYARFGTSDLAHVAVVALAGRKACLLAHHGMIAIGRDPADALEVAEQVETLAEMYWRALQIGEPPLLSDEEMAGVIAKFATYGAPSRR